MRPLGFALVLLASLATSPAFAEIGVNLSFDGCTGPVTKHITAGSVLDAYTSVIGQSQVACAYKVVLLASGPGPAVSDAWRFDAAGCEGSSFFTLSHLSPAALSKTCPSFQGAFQSLQIKDYSYNVGTGIARITLANSYPNSDPATGETRGNPGAVDPATRYYLGGYHFDFTYANVGPTSADRSTCGGVETQVCITVGSASWLDLAGNEITWQSSGNYVLGVNDPTLIGTICGSVVLAAPKTWGAVKSQYRN